MRESHNEIIRHTIKGNWEINSQELENAIGKVLAPRVEAIIRETLPEGAEKTSLTLEGIAKAVQFSKNLFDKAPNRAVLITLSSPKERAQLTEAIIQETLYGLGSNQDGENKKRIDTVTIDGKEMSKLLADSDPSTWGPYEKMIEDGMSEPEAIAVWLNDMNAADSKVDPNVHPKESAERYRNFIKIIRQSIKSGESNIPIIVLGIGHSGSLGQLKYENKGSEVTADDMPDFCEAHQFDDQGNYLGSEKTEVK